MEITAKHTVGNAIHVKIFYRDDNVSFRHYGHVTGSCFRKGKIFRDRIFYDLALEQAEGPDILIQNLPEGFVLAGGPEIEDENGNVKESLLPVLGELTKPAN